MLRHQLDFRAHIRIATAIRALQLSAIRNARTVLRLVIYMIDAVTRGEPLIKFAQANQFPTKSGPMRSSHVHLYYSLHDILQTPRARIVSGRREIGGIMCAAL